MENTKNTCTTNQLEQMTNKLVAHVKKDQIESIIESVYQIASFLEEKGLMEDKKKYPYQAKI